MHTTRQLCYAIGVTLLVMATVISASFITKHYTFLFDPSRQDSHRTNTKDLRTGTINIQTDPYRCEQAKFDNVTGRISDPRPCDDLGGMPMPKGTLHRVEEIRKSFAGDRN